LIACCRNDSRRPASAAVNYWRFKYVRRIAAITSVSIPMCLVPTSSPQALPRDERLSVILLTLRDGNPEQILKFSLNCTLRTRSMQSASSGLRVLRYSDHLLSSSNAYILPVT
jgi:hypothetical protein